MKPVFKLPSIALRDTASAKTRGRLSIFLLAGVIFLLSLSAPVLAASTAVVTGTGLNNFNQATIPSTLSGNPSLYAGREFSLALKQDGSVTGWGHPGEGRSTPPDKLTGVVSLSAGIYHVLALKANGTVLGWGFNGHDILSIPPNLSKVMAVAAGGYHSLALLRDGTVVGWGFDGNGRTTAPANLRDVIAIEAGRDFSVALKSDGTVVAWGLNDEGQTNVPAGLTHVIAIAAGENHTLALKDDGTVVAWGLNEYGQATVPVGLTGVVAISAGAQHSLALKSNGTVQGWGDNTNGQLNLSGSDIRAIAAGGFHSLALHGTGPLITGKPRNQTAVSGTRITFSATASGTGLTYQWQFEGVDIAGETNATLTVANANRANAGVYTVKITSADGSVVTSSAALLLRGRLKPSQPEKLPSGAMRLTFADEFNDAISAPNASRYKMEYSDDLQTWKPLPQAVSLTNGKLQVDDPSASQCKQRFYRATEN